MATFKDLQDRIALDYLNRMTLMPEVQRAIKNAIKSLEARRFWFNEAQTAIATTASQSYLSLPADFLALDRAEITASGVSYALREQPFDRIREMTLDAPEAEPTDFAYQGDRLELAAVPASAHSVTVFYIKALPDLSADTDSNAWTNEAGNYVAHLATVDLLCCVLKTEDDRLITRHTRMAQQARIELESRNDLRFHTRLRATSF